MSDTKISSNTRPFKAGKQLGQAIVETVHILYLDDNALEYLLGLTSVLNVEFRRRLKENEQR